MELAEIIKILKKNITTVAVIALLGTVIGVLVYVIPPRYISTGSFFVTRTVESSQAYFTYEGYYSQQTAAAYTNTAAALLESVDLRTKALELAKIDPSEKNLRKYAKYIDVKKKAPQLITLTVKEMTKERSSQLWNSLAQTLITSSEGANRLGDQNLKIVKISDNPVVKPEYKSIYVDGLTGLVGGFGVGLFLVGLSHYYANSDERNSYAKHNYLKNSGNKK